MTGKTRLILHVGMGKTGTTSIQSALRANSETLATQGFHVLDGFGEGFGTLAEVAGIQRLDAERQTDLARTLADTLISRSSPEGLSTFIYSNEGLFAPAEKMTAFVTGLAERLDLQIIAFVRHPQDWLPSAYVQWGVKHRIGGRGRQGLREVAERYVAQYEVLETWHDLVGANLLIEPYEPGVIVVTRFAERLGVAIDAPKERLLRRPSEAELILRAEFNAQRGRATLPKEFNQLVLNPRKADVVSRRDVFDSLTDRECIQDVIAENSALFDRVETTVGFDVLALATKDEGPPPSLSDVDGDLMDHLIHLTIRQAAQIRSLDVSVKRLTRQVRDLEAAQVAADTPATHDPALQTEAAAEEIAETPGDTLAQEPTSPEA